MSYFVNSITIFEDLRLHSSPKLTLMHVQVLGWCKASNRLHYKTDFKKQH